eukprot:587305-Amphidinium_carterae.1
MAKPTNEKRPFLKKEQPRNRAYSSEPRWIQPSVRIRGACNPERQVERRDDPKANRPTGLHVVTACLCSFLLDSILQHTFQRKKAFLHVVALHPHVFGVDLVPLCCIRRQKQ